MSYYIPSSTIRPTSNNNSQHHVSHSSRQGDQAALQAPHLKSAAAGISRNTLPSGRSEENSPTAPRLEDRSDPKDLASQYT